MKKAYLWTAGSSRFWWELEDIWIDQHGVHSSNYRVMDHWRAHAWVDKEGCWPLESIGKFIRLPDE